jgi:flagellar protein FlaG
MSNITPLNAAPTAPASGSGPPAPAKTAAPAAASTPSQASGASAASSQRLVIKEGDQAGVLIYTVLDRQSGEIVVQIPREMVIKLGARPDYSAGQIISTEA